MIHSDRLVPAVGIRQFRAVGLEIGASSILLENCAVTKEKPLSASNLCYTRWFGYPFELLAAPQECSIDVVSRKLVAKMGSIWAGGDGDCTSSTTCGVRVVRLQKAADSTSRRVSVFDSRGKGKGCACVLHLRALPFRSHIRPYLCRCQLLPG